MLVIRFKQPLETIKERNMNSPFANRRKPRKIGNEDEEDSTTEQGARSPATLIISGLELTTI